MKKLLILFLIFMGTAIVSSHQDDQKSRADFFKSELGTTTKQFDSIAKIDQKFATKYQKLSANLEVKMANLNEVIKQKPYNEETVKAALINVYNIRMTIRLNNIQQHLEIENHLDSFQKKKFNEYFSP
jgi:Spy/CpxP family protein refolding chaperone